MNNKFGWYIIAVIFILEGLISIFGYKVFSKYSGWILLSIESSVLFILTGFFIIYLVGKMKKTIEYSICPKCEESYTYAELEDGICPKCDIKTVDLEGYYKKAKG